MAGDSDQQAGDGGTFGSCCDLLRQAMSAEDGFDPLISVGKEGVLMIGVGLVELEGDEQGTFEHPLFYCPFCGTKLQSPEEVEAKVGGEAAV